ncbi:serine hydrolase domain-containing protein [Kineosporia succinea]|uniref:CubicO group peptidase (Beta-lactamase class C family) n=1 Tax=Kineosporia succinea TaxID=84632 RepID=A0ABT9PCJ6_9ACTN|nr:serine hydrolase domain-containing protein [Kineosporia succinea]MDP9830437.1 CubicO group peptidase (beta-lactamase class C family) [Kineosporia succinea]
MAILLRVLLTLLLLTLSTTAAAFAPEPAHRPTAGPAPGPARLDSFVRERLHDTGVPGATYAIVGTNGVEHSASFGTDGDGRPVTTATPFLWGSVSKPVTATLVVLLARDGLLDLDDPVGRHIPSFAKDPARRAITIRQLLTHTSGLPQGLQLTDHYGENRSPAAVTGQIARLDLGPHVHAYSSLNYVVLAAVVESVTGQPMGDALARRLLSPAGMRSVPADPREAEQVLPPGHRFVAGHARAFGSRVDPATRAAGYLVGTLDDLSAFARTQLTGGAVLTDAERATLHREAVDGYALGWRTTTVPGTDEPMVWHGGAAPGYQAAVLLLPGRDQAVVLLQNAYSPFKDATLMDTSMGIAALLAGSQPPVHGTDPLYPGVLAGLVALALILLGAATRVVVHLVHHRPARPLTTALTVTALGLTGAGLHRFPGLLGVSWGQVPLWAPDIAALLDVCAVLLVTLAGLMLARLMLTRLALTRVRLTPSGAAGSSPGRPPGAPRGPRDAAAERVPGSSPGTPH